MKLFRFCLIWALPLFLCSVVILICTGLHLLGKEAERLGDKVNKWGVNKINEGIDLF